MSFLVLEKQDSSGSAYHMWSDCDEWLEYERALVKILKPGYKKTADNLWEHLGQVLQDVLKLAVGEKEILSEDSLSPISSRDGYDEARRFLINLGLVTETSLRGKWGHLVCTKVGYILWELVNGHEGLSATDDGRG